MPQQHDRTIRRIGFVSTRIAGTDGVSLEIGKWTEILERMGYECCFIAGRCNRDPRRTCLIPQADFEHPDVREINAKCFGRETRPRQMSRLILTTAAAIKQQLYAAVESLEIDLLIAQNALTIPMNIPLGAALTEFVIETNTPCIAHHHDFVWERERYLVNAVHDYLAAVFPPRLEEIEHIVINSVAGSEFARRTGLSYRVIPNVMNYNQPPPPPDDDYCCDFRQTIGLAEDDRLLLQPTRVVQRKGIEHSIELVRRLEDPRCRLVITHGENDEGPEYPARIRQYADLLGVELVFAARWVRPERGRLDDGCKCFSIWDAYRQADLIMYPSTYEGFGNAFLEAAYYKKPIFYNRYAIFQADIEPLGFQGAAMDGFITDDVVQTVRRLLDDEDFRRQTVDHNYQIAKQHFSYDRAETELRAILARIARQTGQ